MTPLRPLLLSALLLGVGAAAGVAAGVAATAAGLENTEDGPDFQVVDLHAHSFNLRYLPLRGVLRNYGVPPLLARLVAWILLEFTEDDPALEDAPPSSAGADIPRDLSRRDLDGTAHSVSSWVSRQLAAGPPIRSPFSDRSLLRVLDRLPPEEVEELFPDPVLRSYFDSFRHRSTGLQGLQRSWKHRRNFAASLAEGRYRRFVERVMERAFGEEASRRGERRGEAGRWETLLQNLQLFHLMQLSERSLAARLFDLHPRVGLAIHHSVDLALRYRGRPALSFPRALARARGLTRSLRGRALRFVPFDPARGDGLDWVRRELGEEAALGVKLYPPSGFLPLGNRSRRIDGRLRELYEFSLAEGVPLFTHCNDGGFETSDGDGARFAVPERWLPVLAEYPELRLGLGHAGEYEHWYTAPRSRGEDWEFLKSRAGIAYQLAVEYPNVYLDFGYHAEALDPAKAARLRTRLEWCIRRRPGFAKKICYGSDYPMVSRKVGYERYLKAFWEVFSASPALKVHARDFFRDNAVRFLDLEGFLRRRGELLPAATVRYLQSFVRTLGGKPAPTRPAPWPLRRTLRRSGGS